ncbi:MAG: hypothetical protein RLY60_1483, partial [Pseudomonadota bacterium]
MADALVFPAHKQHGLWHDMVH